MHTDNVPQIDVGQLHIVSVRSLVEFVLQSGDLTSGGFHKRDRAQTGTRCHKRVQRSRPEGYETEVEIAHRVDLPELADAAPADLMILVEGDAAALAPALDAIDGELAGRESAAAGERKEIAPRSIAMGLERLERVTLCQVSVPGPYAAAESMKALKRGLHVFLFSDNVPLAEEQSIKRLAAQKGLLVMGPDCGTAIIGGVPLGFA